MRTIGRIFWRLLFPSRDGLSFWRRRVRGAGWAVGFDGIVGGAETLGEARQEVRSVTREEVIGLPRSEWSTLMQASYRSFWLQGLWLLVVYAVWFTLLLATHTRLSWMYAIGLAVYSACHATSMLLAATANWRLRHPNTPGWRAFLAAGDERWPRRG